MNQPVRLSTVLDELEAGRNVLARFEESMLNCRKLQMSSILTENDSDAFAQIVGRVVLGAWKADTQVRELEKIRDNHPDYQPTGPETTGENDTNNGDQD